MTPNRWLGCGGRAGQYARQKLRGSGALVLELGPHAVARGLAAAVAGRRWRGSYVTRGPARTARPRRGAPPGPSGSSGPGAWALVELGASPGPVAPAPRRWHESYVTARPAGA